MAMTFDGRSHLTRSDETQLTPNADEEGVPVSGAGDELPAPRSLADALDFVQRHQRLPTSQLAEAWSAVRVLERVTGQDAAQLPAAPKLLTPILEHVFPARYRLKPKRWSNAVSAIRGLLRGCDLHAPATRGARPSDPVWDALVRSLPGPEKGPGRASLLGFARFCSSAGVQPDEVTEQTLVEYAHYRQTQTIRVYLPCLISTVRRYWNCGVQARLPGWPSRFLAAPRRSHVEALPLGSFPTQFQTELATYLSKRTKPDAFDADQQLLRPATVCAVRSFLIRAASLNAMRLGGPEHIRSLADLVTVEAVEFVLRHVFKRSGNVWREHAGNYATYLLALARDLASMDTTAVARIEELRRVVKKRMREQRKPGLSERASQRIMPFDNHRTLRQLFRLPGTLYRNASEQLSGANPRPVRAARTGIDARSPATGSDAPVQSRHHRL